MTTVVAFIGLVTAYLNLRTALIQGNQFPKPRHKGRRKQFRRR